MSSPHQILIQKRKEIASVFERPADDVNSFQDVQMYHIWVQHIESWVRSMCEHARKQDFLAPQLDGFESILLYRCLD